MRGSYAYMAALDKSHCIEFTGKNCKQGLIPVYCTRQEPLILTVENQNSVKQGVTGDQR